MKRTLFLLFYIFLFSSISAQYDLKFDKAGRIMSVPEKEKGNSLDVNTLKKFSADKSAADLKLLNSKFKGTLKSLKDSNSDLYKFYIYIGIPQPSVNIIAKDLETLIKNIDNRSDDKLNFYTNLGGISSRESFTSTVNIYSVKDKEDTIEILLKNNLNIWIKTIVKDSYYQNKGLVEKIDPTTFLSNIVYLQFYRSKLDSLLNEAQKPQNFRNVELMSQASDLIKTLESDAKIAELKSITASDWCTKLAWMNGGQLRLNPLDSKKEEFVISYSLEAQQRARIFNNYINHLLDWYTTKDTTANIEKFKAILKQRNTGTDVFKPFNFNDLMASVSGKTMEDLIPDTNLLNQILSITIKCRNKNKQFFANQEDPKLTCYFKHPLITEESKVFYVHNVSKKETISFDTNSVIIMDKSKFQDDMDTIIGSAAALGALAINLAGYSAILPSKNTIPSNHQIVNEYSNESMVKMASSDWNSKKTYSNFSVASLDYMDQLKEKKVYDKEMFDFAEKLISVDTLPNKERFKIKLIENNKKHIWINDYEDYLNALKNGYDSAMVVKHNSLVDDLKDLRTNVSMLCEVFSKSSLPDKLLDDRAESVTPDFCTKKFEVKTQEKPTQVTVKVKRSDGKETKEITRFKFKTGKTYRIQISAGLALTGRFKKDKDLIQTTITEKDGGLEIKNSYQPLRFVAGLHCQLGKGLHLQNNGFIFCGGARNFLGRTSIYFGLGIPKPLENIYSGLGFDLWPGLKLVVGCHAYRNDSYQISNNKIVEQKVNFNGAPFISINIDPTGFIKGLDIIKKLN